MRDIKFRAWFGIPESHLAPSMTYLDVSKFQDQEYFLIVRHSDNLMQYTGLKDKNGVEIYDGDIVKAIAEEKYFECSKISQIARSSANTSWCVLKPGYTLGMHLLWGGWKSLEIIGNIYQNPKLLSN